MTRQMLVEGDDESSSDNKIAIKMEVDLPLKISSRGAIDAPIDLTLDSDSDKENEHNHPGPT